MQCLDDDAILAVAVGDGAVATIEAHLDACDRCRRLVAEAMRGDDDPAPASPIGRVVLNHRITRKIGEGGFGVVYEAEHVEIGRRSAVKVLRPEYAAAPVAVERFFREARAACAIAHPAVVQIENFGRLDSGEPFYLMELIDGHTLAHEIERGPLGSDRLRTVFEPIADALAHAHRRGIIHRDLKPENIMLLSRAAGGVKLLDFGIAKLLEDVGGLRSRTGHFVGTPSYMAPEQADDETPVDTRADIYSFAATFFTAAAGRPPFVARNLLALIAAVQQQEAPPLSAHASWATAELTRALARCLAKRPADRPPTIEEAWAAISRGLDGGTARPPRRRPARIALIAAGVVGLAASAWLIAPRFAPAHRDTAVAPIAAPSVDASAALAVDSAATQVAEQAPADAAVPIVAVTPQPPRRLRHPTAPQPPPPPPPPQPEAQCVRTRFDGVLRDATLPLEQVRDALKDLRACRGRGLIDVTDYDRIQRALLSRL